MSIEAVNSHSGSTHAIQPTLFFEFQGVTDNAVSEMADLVREIASGNGGSGFEYAGPSPASKLLNCYADLVLCGPRREGAKPWFGLNRFCAVRSLSLAELSGAARDTLREMVW